MRKEEKDMTGVLFVNDRKESAKHPDWNGKGPILAYMWRTTLWRRVS